MNSLFSRVSLLCAAAIIGIAIFSSTGITEPFFGFQFKGEEVPFWHAGLAFLSTFSGVFFALFIQNQSKDILKITWREFGKSALQYSTPGSLMIAAVVYVYAFQSIYASVGDWIAYFSAFQSGFFFKQTLESLMKGEKAVQAQGV